MLIDWHYCKYCVGTGEHPHKAGYAQCRQCGGNGMVPASKWKQQKHSLGGGRRHSAGYGPVPPHEINARLKAGLKPRLLSTFVSWCPLRLKELNDDRRT